MNLERIKYVIADLKKELATNSSLSARLRKVITAQVKRLEKELSEIERAYATARALEQKTIEWIITEMMY